jgi:hypothetical protein
VEEGAADMCGSGFDKQQQKLVPGIVFCEECRELLDRFTQAVHDVVTLNERHLLAVVENEPDPHRFDILIHEANERKQNAKYGYVTHIGMHGSPAK